MLRIKICAIFSYEMNQQIVVKKFGGTSVGSLERIELVADRIVSDCKRGQLPVVVASAMSGETNRLVDLGQKINPGYRGPAYDMLVASGEQVSIALLAMALIKRGYAAQPLLAFQIGIQTDNLYSKARIQNIDSQKLENLLEKKIIPVVAGFQGIDENSQITTLGRGGSDTTGVALAAALQASSCEIYTDVPAVFTADPRLVVRAREIQKLSFEEMMEMASLGSKVLHIRSVEIAAKYGIRIHLRSTFEEREGTWVVPEGEVMEKAVVSSVTHDPATVVFKLFPTPPETQFLGQLFKELADRGVNVDIITQSKNEQGQQLAFSVSKEDHPLVRDILNKHSASGITITEMPDMAKISVVGVGMRNHFGVAATFFQTLAQQSIPVHLVTTSEIKISAVIESQYLKSAAEALHSAFSLDQ